MQRVVGTGYLRAGGGRAGESGQRGGGGVIFPGRCVWTISADSLHLLFLFPRMYKCFFFQWGRMLLFSQVFFSSKLMWPYTITINTIIRIILLPYLWNSQRSVGLMLWTTLLKIVCLSALYAYMPLIMSWFNGWFNYNLDVKKILILL